MVSKETNKRGKKHRGLPDYPLSQCIRFLRTTHSGWSLADLATAAHINEDRFRQIETGKLLPDLGELKAIFATMDVKQNYAKEALEKYPSLLAENMMVID